MNSDCLFSLLAVSSSVKQKEGLAGNLGPFLFSESMNGTRMISRRPRAQQSYPILCTTQYLQMHRTISHILAVTEQRPVAGSLGRATHGPHPRLLNRESVCVYVCVLTTSEAAERRSCWEKCHQPHPCRSPLSGHMPLKRDI